MKRLITLVKSLFISINDEDFQPIREDDAPKLIIIEPKDTIGYIQIKDFKNNDSV